MSERKPLGETLVSVNAITEEQLEEALIEHEKSGKKLGQVILEKGYITEQQLLEILEFSMGFPHVQISKMKIDEEAVKSIQADFSRKHKVFPISLKQGNLTVAMNDPLNIDVINELQVFTGTTVIPVIASEKEIETAIQTHMSIILDDRARELFNKILREDSKSNISKSKTQELVDEAPYIELVNRILLQAVRSKASDIHIEPTEDKLKIRFRLDGELYEVLEAPSKTARPIASRLKVMASMDIAERRIPQDGRISEIIDNREIDFRINTLPTIYGEKIVLRLLDKENMLLRISDLGLSKPNEKNVYDLVNRPYGIILITGPTGSGKTTTLYSMLGEMNSASKNVVTLEDPVEYSLKGINQVQVNTKTGMTFANGLRSILRQDPDIIMVGEIRDQETAELATRAALTGHLVLSTLHTNSAAGSIARMSDMGIENYLITSSLIAIVSQRLVRRLCSNCKTSYTLTEEEAKKLHIPDEANNVFYESKGCNMCRHTGYQGRVAVHEVMLINQNLREAIIKNTTSDVALEEIAIKEGMATIKQDGIEKAKQGITSIEEIMKVIQISQ